MQYLHILEKYNIIVPIDVTSFYYYGGSFGSNQENSGISFSLPEGLDVDSTVTAIKNSYYKPIEAETMVTVRKDKKEWEPDKRPVITVMLPCGTSGRNPAQFQFVTEETYIQFCQRYKTDVFYSID
mgnify:FL=1